MAPVADCSLSAKRLLGKVAIITGGASGIGATSARLFVAHGARVVIADIQDELGAALVEELSPQAKFFHCDVTQESDVEALVSSTLRSFGGLDIMYCNAGILGPLGCPIQELDITVMDRLYNVNVRGALLCTKHAAKVMIPEKKGVILATTSISSMLGGVGPLMYAASKAGLVGMLRSAAYELGKHGIRVNSISPLGVPTPMSWANVKPHYGIKSDDEFATIVSGMADLKGAVLKADDVARAALFLASDDAQFVTGHTLIVDGGFSVCKGH